MMRLELQTKATQSFAMNPQMDLSIKILEMSSMELSEYLQNVVLENPVVDLDSELTTKECAEEQRKIKPDWLDTLSKNDNQNTSYYDTPNDDFNNTIAQPIFNTLEEYITQQISLDCPNELSNAATYAAGYLDEDGYFSISAKEMSQYNIYSESEIECAITYIQGLEPPGVGARNLSECLLLQLGNNGFIAREIVSKHLDLLAKGKISQLSKKLRVSEAAVSCAAKRIRKLNPKPGSGFGSVHMVPYITPDIAVESFDNRFYVLPRTHSTANFHLNTSYIDIMRKTGEKEVVDYINNKIKQAQWIEKCIASRAETLYRVAKEVVNRQERFFRYGSKYMCILKMGEIAKMLNLHESSVSRAVKNKYIECAHGIFPLKYFFVQGLDTANGNNISSHEIKHEIRALIEKENKSVPLSDQKIASFFENRGIKLSRRTVTKYREQLQIPTSFYRVSRSLTTQ